VRLEFTEGVDPTLRELLREHFQLHPADIYEWSGELDYTTLFELAGLNISGLTDPAWMPITSPALRDNGTDIFEAIRGGDVLVHYPYESFETGVEHFIEAAADDPQVVSIKMTVYRVGDDTPFARTLIRAAEAGKQVACVIELTARFDEERNLHWAAALEKAGGARYFWGQGFEDSCQDGAGGSQGVRRLARLRAHRHGKLSCPDGAPL
jgi:polyphosphate kinase